MNILLVDDEPLVRGYIRSQLEQLEELQISCSEVASAREALRRIEAEQPDVALIDVKMPGMSGVELVREIARRWPHVACVMLSGHDDFSYVRDSMALGALDYLLKHRVTREMLGATLRSARAKQIERLRADQRIAQADRAARVAQPLLDERLLRAAIAAEPLPEDAQAHWRQLLARHGGKVRLAVFEIHRVDLQAQSPQRSLRIRQRAMAVAQEALAGKGPLVQMGDAQWVALMGESSAASERAAEKVCNALRLFLNLRAQAAISGAFAELEACPARYRQTLLDMEARYPVAGLTPEQTERLLGALNSRSALFLRTECARLFSGLAHGDANAQRVVEDALALLWLFAGQSGLDADGLLGEPQQLLSGADGATSARILCEMAMGLLQAHQGQHEADRKGTGRSVHIDEATTYIRAHYAEELTLEGVATHVCVSPTYLSRLFREACGCTFTEYINSLRVELASRYLKRGVSATEAAQLVGFSSPSYFFRVFKSVTGRTPAAYTKDSKIVHEMGKFVD